MSLPKSNISRLIIVGVILLLLPGFFGCYSAMTSVTSATPTPTVEVDSTIVNVGTIKRDRPLAISLKIRNTGEEPLVLNRKATENDCVCIGEQEDFVVGPKSVEYFTLRIQPRQSAGNFQLDIAFDSNDPKTPVLNFTVQGNRKGAGSQMMAHPEQLASYRRN